MIKNRVQLGGLVPEMWAENESCNTLINSFITEDMRLLVAFNDMINGLSFDSAIPCVPVREITYFIKQVNPSL